MLMLNQVVAGTEETMVPQAEEIPPTAHAGHVLLVEDDDGMRMLISRALRESGYRVTGCRNGAEMWRFLPEGGVDLVLLDVMLPGASGLDLLRALRSKGTLPVIMLSARAEEADRVLGLELGADDYVAKPFGRPELLARVRAVLRRSAVAPTPTATARPETLAFAGWRLDLRGRVLTDPEGASVDLSGRGIRPSPRLPRASRARDGPRPDTGDEPRPFRLVVRSQRRHACQPPAAQARTARGPATRHQDHTRFRLHAGLDGRARVSRLAALARSLEARTVAVLLMAILAIHGGALLLYRQSAAAAADDAFARQVVSQLTLAREAVLRRPLPERDAEAKALSSAHFELGWSSISPLRQDEAADPGLWSLRTRMISLAPSLGNGLALAMGAGDEAGHQEDLGGALALPDGSFLTFRSAHAPHLARLGPWAYLSTAMAIFVGVAAVVLMHRIAGPLRDLTCATGKIGHGEVVPVREAGPDETREIARALNAMQTRIHRLVTERTQALAAVSHDLRTPIARLRLRLDGMPDAVDSRAMGSDLDDMQAMIDSTLAYLRGEADPEPRKIINVASLLMSIADASSDAGRDVVYDGPGRALATVRPVALRRALENLVDNAVRYGSRARLSLAVEPDNLLVLVEDDGPGIAPDDVARAFEPFTRLEASRNRDTGGTGLGLTIARRVIEDERGCITLTNQPKGGLRAQVSLPRTNR